jgi:multiple sugar transport system ATP-binding protein
MASVELKNVSKVFRPKKAEEIYAVTNLDLAIADKELVVLVGPSGCGKTTTLRLIAGLEEATSGTVSIGGVVMNEVLAQDRDVAMVFQRDTLYPHMTVFENMAFGLELRHVSKAEIETRIKSLANILGVTPLLHRHPRDLSGGQRQRVALGRALVRNPKVLMLDEPLSNLDAPLRAQIRGEIARLHTRLGTTMLYVTHDQSDAMTLGGRIAVMREGAIQQIGDALALYHSPANVFVAGFIGSPPMNLLRGRVVQNGEDYVFQESNPAGTAQGSRLELALPSKRGERLSRFEGNIVLGIRPEHILLDDGLSSLQATNVPLERTESLGSEKHLHFNTGAHTFVARVRPEVPFQSGERVPLRFDLTKAFFFHPVSGTPII